MGTFGIKLTAAEALSKKYGFSPAPQQVTLLESDGEGTYILFRVGEHEYRFEDSEITNLDAQKVFDEEINRYIEIGLMRQRDLDELREQHAKQEKQFITKELMLTEAYNAKRAEIETLKGEIRFLQSLADDRMKEIERLEAKIKATK